MSDFDEANGERLYDKRPVNTGPVGQELKNGHTLLALGNDTYAEVSLFKGRVYASVRKWFQADDMRWYRTKNGLNMKADEFITILGKSEELVSFINSELQHPYVDMTQAY